jgi:hypothetical protein
MPRLEWTKGVPLNLPLYVAIRGSRNISNWTLTMDH